MITFTWSGLALCWQKNPLPLILAIGVLKIAVDIMAVVDETGQGIDSIGIVMA